MKNEIWTFIPTTNGFFQISNLGRIRKVSRNLKKYGIHIYNAPIYELVEPKIVEKKYLDVVHHVPVVNITIHGLKFQKNPISELMFLAFHGIANIRATEIIHLDGNEQNNELENLVLSKPIFKLQYLALEGFSESKNADSKRLRNQFANLNCISKYNKSGELKRVFSNLSNVKEEDEIEASLLLKNIKARQVLPIKNHFYKRGHGPQLLDFSIVFDDSFNAANFRERRRYYILQYSKFGNLISVFVNVEQASKGTQCLKQHVLKSIKTRQMIERYLWVELEDLEIDKITT